MIGAYSVDQIQIRQRALSCCIIPCSICDLPSGAVVMQISTYSPGVKFASKKDCIPGAITAIPPANVPKLSSDGAAPV